MNSTGADTNDLDKHFKLMADIDLSEFTGEQFNIIGKDLRNSFTGVFDGNDHTISNFTYSTTGTNYIGIFGYVYNTNAEIFPAMRYWGGNVGRSADRGSI